MKLNYNINLLEDGSVVTRDGEFLGTYDLDADDHPHFTPEGETEPTISHPFLAMFCKAIEDWHNAETSQQR